MNAAARLIYSSLRFEHIIPLLHQLHWLNAKEWTDFKLAVLAFKWVHGSAPPYFIDELSHPADSQARCKLRLASSSILVVHWTCLMTTGDQSFPVTMSHVWNNLPQHVIAWHYLQVFKNHLKTQFIFFFFSLISMLFFVKCLRDDFCHFWHFKRYKYKYNYYPQLKLVYIYIYTSFGWGVKVLHMVQGAWVHHRTYAAYSECGEITLARYHHLAKYRHVCLAL